MLPLCLLCNFILSSPLRVCLRPPPQEHCESSLLFLIQLVHFHLATECLVSSFPVLCPGPGSPSHGSKVLGLFQVIPLPQIPLLGPTSKIYLKLEAAPSMSPSPGSEMLSSLWPGSDPMTTPLLPAGISSEFPIFLRVPDKTEKQFYPFVPWFF